MVRVPVRPQLRAGGAGRSLWVRFWDFPKLPVPACGLCPHGSPRAGVRQGNLGPHRAVHKAVLHILTLHRTAARFGSGPWETCCGGGGNKSLTHSLQPFTRVMSRRVLTLQRIKITFRECSLREEGDNMLSISYFINS